jgi:hypothetical protein
MNRSYALVNKLGGIYQNLLLNPNFTTDTTSWVPSSSSLASVAGELRITETGGINPGQAYQDITTIVGRLYRVIFAFKKGTSATGSLKIGTTAAPTSIYNGAGLSDVTITARQLFFVATDVITRVTLQSDSTVAGETSFFDAVTCCEINNGFGNIMTNCKIAFYTAPMPATPELAATGTLLCTMTENDDGTTPLTWEQSLLGAVSKSLTESWKGTVTISGTAAWFRIYEENDNPALGSDTASRIDGTISTAGGDLNITSVFFLENSVKEITFLQYTQPRV